VTGSGRRTEDDAQLAALGYSAEFERSMGLWANMALGFTYRSPLRVTAFAVLGIYIAFQAVVLAALRQRLKGWRPAGVWNLGRWGTAVNVVALAYGIFAMVLLLQPADAEAFLDRWIVAVGISIVGGSGLLYLLLGRPDGRSGDFPEGDAREVAARLQAIRRDAYTTVRSEEI
jgi:hypothetical protein